MGDVVFVRIVCTDPSLSDGPDRTEGRPPLEGIREYGFSNAE